MKPCPRCHQIPMWHLATNVTQRMGEQFYSFNGCYHGNTFGLGKGFVPKAQLAEVSREWDELQETVFTEYTSGWTEVERIRFRTKLFGVDKPPLQPS